MNDNELINIWKSYDQKLDQVLTLNKKLTFNLTKDKLNKTINQLRTFKTSVIFLGIPYLVLLYAITAIAIKAGGYFVAAGFGAISIIMSIVMIAYIYQRFLIGQINKDDDVINVQAKLSALKISTFNTTKLAILQIPFWSVCWISINALRTSTFVYGGVNLLVFLAFCAVTVWLYRNLNIDKMENKVNQFFFSGIEWDPIIKSTEILDQLKEYESK
ncbi:hypothetical protein [Portibacter lacus]|uniref:Uncharacterized protein n=1 Tax=Portibacter lacus TaxID=1099794 RepID=A0AA37SRI0_9BACT|nr:hypothetical protein [Portibacter lacus]GLR17466.1 hypothetical protein GCM10007940_20810 [Portibacter lacus]